MGDERRHARKYCVFWSIGDKFNGVPPSDPRFANMVTEYVNAWMAYVKQTGFNPKDVVVLLYDEPSREEQAKKIMAWARPIKERCPEFTIFEDPCFNDPRPVDPEFFKLNDVLCPMTRMIHAMWKFPQEDPNFNGNFRDFYVQKRKEGAEWRSVWPVTLPTAAYFASCCRRSPIPVCRLAQGQDESCGRQFP